MHKIVADKLGEDTRIATFRKEEVQQILHWAMAHQQEGEFDEQQLKEMASELGISPNALQAAQQEWLRERERLKQRQVFDSQRRRKFKAHLIKSVHRLLVPQAMTASDASKRAPYPK